MLTNICLNHLRTVGQCLWHQARRNIGVSAVLAQKAEDPIQQLFVEKIREYAQKKKAAGGKLVDVTPETMKDLEFELERLQMQYRAAGQDMTKFPSFDFVEILQFFIEDEVLVLVLPKDDDKSVEAAPTLERRDVSDLPL